MQANNIPSSKILRVSVLILIAFPLSASPAQADRAGMDEACYKIIHEKAEASPQERAACLEKYVTFVVTANRAERSLLEVPGSMSVISAPQIEQGSGDSVADAVRDVPGVEISDAGEPGFKRLRIRGEDSRRVAVFIDGQEFLDSREVGTPLLLAPEQIERIEVLRGPASVMYGSRAIGGVINIITKKGGYHPVQATAGGTLDSGANAYQTFASTYGSIRDFDYRVGITKSDYQNREIPHGTLDNTSFDNESLSSYIAYSPGEHRIGFGYDIFNARSDVYVDPVVATTPPFLDFRLNAPERDREKFSIFYDWKPEEGVLRSAHVDAFSQISDRELDTFSVTALEVPSPTRVDTAISTTSKSNDLGLNGFVELEAFNFNRIVTGFQLMGTDLEQDRDKLTTIGSLSPTKAGSQELVHDDVSQDRYGLFLQDEIAVLKDWTVTLGGRSDWVDTDLERTTRSGLMPRGSSSDALTGQASIAYGGIDNTNLWFRYAQGFVAPSPIQLATGAYAGPSYVNPNPDLDSETSDSFEIGARYLGKAFNADSAFFISDADDYIDDVLCTSSAAACIEPASSRDRVYANIGSARTFGNESNLSYQIDDFTPYASLTWVRRQLKGEDFASYDSGIPAVTSRIGVRYQNRLNGFMRLWSDFYLRAQSDNRELDGVRTLSDAGWLTTNIVAGLDLGEKRTYRISLGLENLGNVEYLASTENIPAKGFSAILKFSINL